MDVRFIGAEGDATEVCSVFGLDFARDEWVKVPADADPRIVAKLSANPTFEVRGEAPADPLDHDGDGRKGGSLPRRGRPPKASADPAA